MRLWGFPSDLSTTLVRYSKVLVILALMTISTLGYSPRSRPNCELKGHRRLISIPGCVEFIASTNACWGYCESYAFPTPGWQSDTRKITSVGACCSIKDTHDVHISVRCFDGIRTFKFKSAASCECSYCRND